MKTTNRILLYRLGSLGDTVVALPAFHLIRRRFPNAHITVLTNAPISGKAAPLESLLENTGLADAYIHYPVGLRNVLDLARLRNVIRRGRFDALISLTAARGFFASFRDYLFFMSCGIRTLIGIPFHERDLQCMRIDGGAYEPEAERLLRRISSLGEIDLAKRASWDLNLQPAEIQEADRLTTEAGLSAPWIAVSLGTKVPANDWGSRNWTTLLSQINSAAPGSGIVLLGSNDEYARSQECIAGWAGPHANLCGKTSPRVSAAILARAALFIGHDSGPMHLAASSGASCVAIFSTVNPPGQWFPYGARHTILYPRIPFDPSRRRDAAYQSGAISSITVEEVFAAVTRYLPSVATHS